MVELTKNEIDILGRPNFACARMAQILIASGEYANGVKKAEYEQAVYIHWALNLLKEHGDNWVTVGNAKLKDLVGKLAEKAAENA
jgi:hypothetical protein